MKNAWHSVKKVYNDIMKTNNKTTLLQILFAMSAGVMAYQIAVWINTSVASVIGWDKTITYIAPIAEEIVKIVAALLVAKISGLDKLKTLIIVALVFGAVETYMYTVNATDNNIDILIQRLVTTNILHVTCAIITRKVGVAGMVVHSGYNMIVSDSFVIICVGYAIYSVIMAAFVLIKIK